MGLFLGIDGGGTKTAAAILDGDGAELGRGYGGAGNIAINSDADLLHSVQTAVADACNAAAISPSNVRFEGVCAAMAGVSAPERLRAFDALLRTAVPASSYRIEPDFVAAYWGAALGEPGIVVIAGTGAVSYGRNSAGETCREDGLGYLLGDRGSGFQLGLRVLRHTLDRLAAEQLDALAKATLAETGTRTQNEILQWLYTDFRPARVAALVPFVGVLSEQGDIAARDHVAAMARQLRHTVCRARQRLLLPSDTPIYPVGGLWHLGSFFRNEFAEPQWRFPRAAEAAATKARSRPAPTNLTPRPSLKGREPIKSSPFPVSAANVLGKGAGGLGSVGRLRGRVTAILIARHRERNDPQLRREKPGGRKSKSTAGGPFHIASPCRDAAYGAALLASYQDRLEELPDDFARRHKAAREDGAEGL